MPKTYFVSGHLDLTEEEFNEHYAPKLHSALGEGAAFVVGDARGCDMQAQELLSIWTKNVTVYHMFWRPRNLKDTEFKMWGGFETDRDRDEAMTLASDDDIAWVRPGRETSGTAKNLKRRQGLG